MGSMDPSHDLMLTGLRAIWTLQNELSTEGVRYLFETVDKQAAKINDLEGKIDKLTKILSEDGWETAMINSALGSPEPAEDVYSKTNATKTQASDQLAKDQKGDEKNGIEEASKNKSHDDTTILRQNSNIIFKSTPEMSEDEKEFILFIQELGNKIENRHMFTAASKGYANAVRLLISKGCNKNAVDVLKRNVMKVALMEGHADVVQALLEENATTESTYKQGNSDIKCSIMHLAASYGNLEVIIVLQLFGLPLEDKDAFERTPMHYAARDGQYRIIDYLIDEGCNLNAVDRDQKTPLHIASEAGQIEAVHKLLERGADAEAVTENSLWTPLHFAAQSGHLNIVELLLRENARIDPLNEFGRTPLRLAVTSFRSDVVEKLLNAGADPDLADTKGTTPKQQAKINGFHKRFFKF